MLFAAGLGTRLKPFTDHHPKALARVNGKTLLELNIRYLQKAGIDEVVVNVHHFPEQIEDLLREHNGFGSVVHISDERSEVLETGGGLMKAASFFTGEDFVVMNVDILTDLHLQQMIDAHLLHRPVATLAVMSRPSPRQLLFDTGMQLCGWKNNSNGALRMARTSAELHEFAFSGIQILGNRFLTQVRQQGKFSIIDAYLDLAATQAIRGFDHSGSQLLDVGKPESLLKAELLFP
jgi:MurNAc alpha-1-phosphate uridylyltransferase